MLRSHNKTVAILDMVPNVSYFFIEIIMVSSWVGTLNFRNADNNEQCMKINLTPLMNTSIYFKEWFFDILLGAIGLHNGLKLR